MARHMCHYLKLLCIPYFQWCRAKSSKQALDNFLSRSTHVLILISDHQIEPFITQYLPSNKPLLKVIHFSGSLSVKGAVGAHPLYSFADQLYDLATYQSFPFILEEKSGCFETLFPGLKNPHYFIPASLKPYYHALCVMANNFTVLLWQKFFKSMQESFSISQAHLSPYLIQTFKNLQEKPLSALTGPIERGDKATLQADLEALQGDDFYEIFKAFMGFAK